MGQRTPIQAVDSTVNPTSGCDGCELWKPDVGMLACFAGHQHTGMLHGFNPRAYGADFGDVRTHPGRVVKAVATLGDLTGKPRPAKPWLDGLPRMIFIGDLSDIFSKAIPFDYLWSEVVRPFLTPRGVRMIGQIYTKRASRAVDFARWLRAEKGLEWPANLWVGTSVTTTGTVKRAVALAEHPAPVRFLSVEPMLGRVFIPPDVLRAFRWVVMGGESNQPGWQARPCDVAWIEGLIADCRSLRVAPFVKQVGSRPVDSRDPLFMDWPAGPIPATGEPRDSHGGDWDEWPARIRVREMPKPVPVEIDRRAELALG